MGAQSPVMVDRVVVLDWKTREVVIVHKSAIWVLQSVERESEYVNLWSHPMLEFLCQPAALKKGPGGVQLR